MKESEFCEHITKNIPTALKYLKEKGSTESTCCVMCYRSDAKVVEKLKTGNATKFVQKCTAKAFFTLSDAFVERIISFLHSFIRKIKKQALDL